MQLIELHVTFLSVELLGHCGETLLKLCDFISNSTIIVTLRIYPTLLQEKFQMYQNRLGLSTNPCLPILTLILIVSCVQKERSSLINEASTHVVGRRRDQCSIPLAKPIAANPVLISSYPGSGAKLTWKLLRSVTGVMTSDDHDHNGLAKTKEVIGIKTHYPVPSVSNQNTFLPFGDVQRTILLLRNPVDAISSYHNFRYEMSNNLQNHSIRAPVDKWIVWRDEHFIEELKAWVEHLNFWMLNRSHENRLILVFEHLVSSQHGPHELQRMKNFVRLYNENIVNANDIDIPCIWDLMVKNPIDEGTRMSSLRRGDPDTNLVPLSDNQVKEVYHELMGIQNRYPEELSFVINEYLEKLSKDYKHTSFHREISKI